MSLVGCHLPCDGPIWFRQVPSERYYKDLSFIIFIYYFKKNFYLSIFCLKFMFKHDRSSRVRMLYSRVKCNQLINWEIYIHEELVRYTDLPVRVSTNLPEGGSQGGKITLIGLRPRGSETKIMIFSSQQMSLN